MAEGTVNHIMDSNTNFIDTLKELNLRREKENQDSKEKSAKRVSESVTIIFHSHCVR